MKLTYFACFAALLITTGISTSCSNKPKEEQEVTSADSIPSTSPLHDNDKDFMEKAAAGGLMEVELGQYAQDNAQSAAVKNFGAMMVRDHSKANDELKMLAANNNVTLSLALPDHHRKMVDDLKAKKGAEFDNDYIDMMVEDHNEDIDLFKKEAESGRTNEITQFASKTLPVLQSHLDSAKAIQKVVAKK